MLLTKRTADPGEENGKLERIFNARAYLNACGCVCPCVALSCDSIGEGEGRDSEESEQRQRVLNLVPNIYLATILFATFSILRLI